MCNLYQVTSSVEALRILFRAMEGEVPELPAVLRVYPGRVAPVVVETETGRALRGFTWGIPGPRGARGRPVTNVRNLDSPFWRPSLGRQARALVPVSAFCEWSATADPATGRKRQHWFVVRDHPLFAFAGIWRRAPETDGARFAFLTCAPNALVGSIHPRAMPVILDGPAQDRWLAGEPAPLFQNPFPEKRMAMLEDAG